MSFEKHTHYFPSVLTLLSRIAGLLAITASYVHNVHDVHLALEIKTIDDEIAECTQKMDRRGLTAPVPAVKK